MMNPCESCYEPSCAKRCPECNGTGIFIGAGIESIFAPHFYNMANPSKLQCRVCNGEKVIYCPNYREPA